MEIVDSIPLFRTRTITKAPTVAPDPAQRPPLPQSLWVVSIATFGEARRLQMELAKEYVTHLGKAGDFYYVAGPGNGLNSKKGE